MTELQRVSDSEPSVTLAAATKVRGLEDRTLRGHEISWGNRNRVEEEALRDLGFFFQLGAVGTMPGGS